MKELVSVGFTIPSGGENYIRLDSLRSLSDADIAIFCPDLKHTEYSTYESSWANDSGTYEGKGLYNKQSSAQIIEHSAHWKKELLNFVNSGKTLIVILCKRQDFFVHTGTKDFSGTGRNQKIINHVSPYDNYKFLPLDFLKITPSSGRVIKPNAAIVNDFYKNFKDFMKYDVYIEGDKISSPTFTSKNKDRFLGANLKVKNGFLVLIPSLNISIQDFTTYDKENDESYWTDEAVKTGKIFINSIVAIDKALRKEKSKTPQPKWLSAKDFKLQEAEKTKKSIAKNQKEIEKRVAANEELSLILEEQESLKDLLFETGKPLEQAVIKALIVLGYKAENYDDGELELDQVIFSPEGDRYIGECEGKDTKDIDVSKFRQLLDGLNADFEREEIDEKAYGLIFGNPQRLTNPDDRNLDFTRKCQSGAAREKIGLILTADLFKAARYALESDDEEYKVQCRQAIQEKLGMIITFPEVKTI